MNTLTEREYIQVLETMFADVLGYTKKDWADIEVIAAGMKEAGLFKGDPAKCLIAGFVVWFEHTGYVQDDRTSEASLH